MNGHVFLVQDTLNNKDERKTSVNVYRHILYTLIYTGFFF